LFNDVGVAFGETGGSGSGGIEFTADVTSILNIYSADSIRLDASSVTVRKGTILRQVPGAVISGSTLTIYLN
jgi:hypothetical protein